MRTIYRAAYEGDTDTLRLLLQQGAEPNEWYVQDEHDGMTALHYSAQNLRPVCVRLLLQHGADANADYDARPGWSGWTPLMCAIDCGAGQEDPDLVGVVRVLLENGANPNVRHVSTALELAEMNGYEEVARLLRQAGAIE